jgi:hypothetical protein
MEQCRSPASKIVSKVFPAEAPEDQFLVAVP